jgi:hypothetical protein
LLELDHLGKAIKRHTYTHERRQSLGPTVYTHTRHTRHSKRARQPRRRVHDAYRCNRVCTGGRHVGMEINSSAHREEVLEGLRVVQGEVAGSTQTDTYQNVSHAYTRRNADCMMHAPSLSVSILCRTVACRPRGPPAARRAPGTRHHYTPPGRHSRHRERKGTSRISLAWNTHIHH